MSTYIWMPVKHFGRTTGYIEQSAQSYRARVSSHYTHRTAWLNCAFGVHRWIEGSKLDTSLARVATDEVHHSRWRSRASDIIREMYETDRATTPGLVMQERTTRQGRWIHVRGWTRDRCQQARQAIQQAGIQATLSDKLGFSTVEPDCRIGWNWEYQDPQVHGF